MIGGTITIFYVVSLQLQDMDEAYYSLEPVGYYRYLMTTNPFGTEFYVKSRIEFHHKFPLGSFQREDIEKEITRASLWKFHGDFMSRFDGTHTHGNPYLIL